MTDIIYQPIMLVFTAIVFYFAYLYVNQDNEMLRKVFFALSICFLDILIWVCYLISLNLTFNEGLKAVIASAGLGVGLVAIFLLWVVFMGLWEEIMEWWDYKKMKEDHK